MSAATTKRTRKTTRGGRAGLLLAGLTTLAVGPMASPPAMGTGTISLNDIFYIPGSTPTLGFSSSGAPRVAFPYNNVPQEVFLQFSTTQGAIQNSLFPGYLMGTVTGFGQLEIQLNTITCFSKEQFIQGFIQDEATGQLIAFTNEVFLSIDYSSCDPNDPPGGSGCGPGYWRNEQNYSSWPIPLLPSVPFAGVFEDAFPGKTLADVLNEQSGPLNALGRQVVAALLNAESPQVDFDLTSAEVVAAFDAVYPGTKLEYSVLATTLRALNSQSCLLSEVAVRSPEGGTVDR